MRNFQLQRALWFQTIRDSSIDFARSLALESFTASWNQRYQMISHERRRRRRRRRKPAQHPRRFLGQINIMWLQLLKETACQSLQECFSIRFLYILHWQHDQHWGHKHSIAAQYFPQLKLLQYINWHWVYCYLLYKYSHIWTEILQLLLNTSRFVLFNPKAYPYLEIVKIQYQLIYAKFLLCIYSSKKEEKF